MIREEHLQPRAANYQALTPLDFLQRSATLYHDRVAVVWRDQDWTYGAFANAVYALAASLRAHGVKAGDVVSMLCPNRPEILAAHFAVPMLGATLNAINVRLNPDTVSYILEHADARLLIADPTCLQLAEEACATVGTPLLKLGEDSFSGDLAPKEGATWSVPITAHVTDEWQPIALNYTSGTTGRPKGVVLSHRGAYLNALGNMLTLNFTDRTRYLWTLPMFHCNGWCHTWAITAAGGTHICLDRIEPALIFDLMATQGVTHMSCAPVVLYMLVNDPARQDFDASNRILVATGGAAPTSTLITELDYLGLDFIHLYGLTECYGPATLRTLSPSEEDRTTDERAALLARQGVRHVTGSIVRVLDDQGRDVPADGSTMGEIVLAGNTLLSGYYHDPEATQAAFRGDVFHTGDLAVVHPGGDIEIRDRAKDIIISGGENISSLEIEGVLHKHPAVMMAAVVAQPHPKWGETPCAFVELRPGAEADAEEIREFCRDRLAHFKTPGTVDMRALPKTATGKIQKYLLREIATELVDSTG